MPGMMRGAVVLGREVRLAGAGAHRQPVLKVLGGLAGYEEHGEQIESGLRMRGEMRRVGRYQSGHVVWSAKRSRQQGRGVAKLWRRACGKKTTVL